MAKAKEADRFRQLDKLVIEHVPVSDLKPNPWNPNRQSEHEFNLLKASMRTDGFTTPIVALPDGTIVDGEHRWRAASELGHQTVAVVRANMTPEQARVATLRHNRARGSEDVNLTAALLRDLDKLGALDWAQDELAMDDLELERLIGDIPDAPIVSYDGTEAEIGDDGAVTAMSVSAVQQIRKAEQEAARARTAEERQRAAQEKARLFRLELTFYGDEAALVRDRLKDRPAETLVAILREYQANAA